MQYPAVAGLMAGRLAKMPLNLDARALRTPLTALAVCVAYYAGANLGFLLRLPPATPSFMWPPNAILTATLLLVEPRHWWIYLFAALPGHLAAELVAGFPVPLALALFLTNCSEAVLGAVGVRLCSDAPSRFDTLQRVAVFIGAAVFIGPYVSSFLDAAAVTMVRGEAYWVVWRARLQSNVLTELTIVPALVMGIAWGPGWLRTASRARRVEAGLLGAFLLVVAISVFIDPTGMLSLHTQPGAPGTPLAVLLPFVLWAAVRFGPAGASASLLIIALFAIEAAVHKRGPFTQLPMAESVSAIQVSLTIVALTLMCLAALIEERRAAQHILAERLRSEELLSRLSSAFVHLPGHAMDAAFQSWLRQLGEALQLDRLLLLRFSPDNSEMLVPYAWSRPGTAPIVPVARKQELPWLFEQLLDRKIVVFSRPAELPAAAARDVEGYWRRSVWSNLTVPLEAGGQILGGLAFATVTAERAWPADLVQHLRLVTEVFASALARQEAEDALRASELMKSAILASLPTSVAVVDRHGQIIAVNESWLQFAGQEGTWNTGVGMDVSYLDICRQAAGRGIPQASEALLGIEAVLDGSRAAFALEYASGAKDGDRWFAMSVLPLKRREGGAVVSHTDVTERKRAEMDAQQSRQELAHFTRVSTVGELTASLAHELNQPLTGILTNAQAARRFLEATPPDLPELRNILSDIIEDDKRAGEVIHRLRDLLRRSETAYDSIDLNSLIRDVAKLLSSDAIIRNVTVSLDLDPSTLMVTGDRVQLQQVVLNLLLNAMEAMSEREDSERLVVLRTERADSCTVRVSVQDTGTGLPEGRKDLVFEPFYTTKPAGVGMGLAIVRSIVEAHGGAIWATNNSTLGATFHFTVPLGDIRA
jgi:two-component system sensor kinase FixL